MFATAGSWCAGCSIVLMAGAFVFDDAGIGREIVASAIAKAQAASPESIGVLLELWSVMRTGTPLVVILLIAAVYYVNAERKSLQVKYDSMLDRYYQLGTDTNSTLKNIQEMFAAVARPPRT